MTDVLRRLYRTQIESAIVKEKYNSKNIILKM